MKKTILVVIISLMIPIMADAARVRGHMRDTDADGVKDTYVQPHQRTSPDSSRMNNYDYPGNYNPNTGQITPRSDSPRENWPSNPNPYEKPKRNPYSW